MEMVSPLKKLVFVTGTDTGVGKTVITAGLLALFRKRGYRSLAVKPFQTGALDHGGKLSSTDAMFYEIDLPQAEPAEVINPICMAPPAAPWVASILTKETFDLSKVYGTVKKVLPNYDLVLLEGAGGLCVPIEKDFLMADMIRELRCPIIIVARGSLGTINHTLLTVRYAQAQGIPILGVIISGLNQGVDPVADLNPWVIKELSGVPLLGVMPFSPSIDVDRGEAGNLLELLEESLDFDRLERLVFGKS